MKKHKPRSTVKGLLIVLACAVLIALLVATCGCTHFAVTQIDNSPNERTITTKIKGAAWFSSAQGIAKLKALQTDKTQSFGADGLTQQGATNAVDMLRELRGLVEALPK